MSGSPCHRATAAARRIRDDGPGILDQTGGTGILCDSRSVGRKQPLKLLDNIGMLIRQIVRFPDIGAQVIEFRLFLSRLSDADEFPVSATNSVHFVVVNVMW